VLFCIDTIRSLTADYGSRAGFGAEMILFARAAAATDRTDQLSVGDNRDRSDTRQGLPA
jgi:hypothetical protein